MSSRYPPETPEPSAPRTDPASDATNTANTGQRDGGMSGTGSGSMGATEDEVIRGDDAITPEVTDMGLDERGRDQPDGRDFGRGEMPDQIALDDLSDTGGRPDAPRYGRSPRQGLGGAHSSGDANTPRDEYLARDESAANADDPDVTASGTLTTGSSLGASTGGPYGKRGDGGGGQLNAEIPAGMAGAGPLGGSPARGDTMDVMADRRKHGINAPSSSASRGIHLGVGHNSPTGESTPGMRPTSSGDAGAPGGGTPARADTPAAEREPHQFGAPGQSARPVAASAEGQTSPDEPAANAPLRAAAADLPTGSGSGGTRPHINPLLNHLPSEAGKEGRP